MSEMRRLAFAALLLALLVPPVRGQDEPPADDEAAAAPAAEDEGANGREARLTSVEGTVYLHPQDREEGDFVKAQADAELDEGDLVRTGKDGRAEITVDGETVIALEPNTDFVLTSLAPESTEFHLGIGAIAAKIKKLLEGQAMSFRTPTAVAAVRGTELGVSQDGDESPARVGVFDEGNVAVTGAKGGDEVRLGPGQETEVAKGQIARPRELRAFAPLRQRVLRCRQRQDFWRKSWRPLERRERLARRREMRRLRAIRVEKLRNIRADIRQRRYEGIQQRRERRQQREQRHLERQQRPQNPQAEQRRVEEIRERRQQEAQRRREELEQRRRQQETQRKQDEERWKREREQDRQAREQRQRGQEQKRQEIQQRRQRQREEFQKRRRRRD